MRMVTCFPFLVCVCVCEFIQKLANAPHPAGLHVYSYSVLSFWGVLLLLLLLSIKLLDKHLIGL